MRRISIAELVERLLFYFSFSITGIFKRRKMENNYHCNVFAGEEEVTPRSISHIELPTLPVDVPTLPEGGIIPIAQGPPEHPLMMPDEDIVPWCPVPHRRSTRKRAPPAAYTTSVAANAKKTRKRMQTKKTMRKRRPVKRRPKSPRRGSPAQRPQAQGPAPHTPMMSPESPPSTPKSSRAVAKRKPMAHSAMMHRGSGMIHVPRTFLVTIDEMKKEK